MGLLEIKEMTMSFGDKVLFKKAGFYVNKNDKMGIVGVNGAGKSTLLKIINGEVLYDTGSIYINPKVRVGYLDQQALINSEKNIMEYLRESYQYLYDASDELNKTYEAMGLADEKKLIELTNKTERLTSLLEQNGFYSLDSRIKKVADGLGITAFNLETKVKTLSGGQRAKVRLAKLLLEKPDILLLDEPTNFLDTEHIDWLAGYLNSFDGTFVTVSHDEQFLAEVTNCIVDIDNQTITRYNLSFIEYLKEKNKLMAQQQLNYDRQQKKIDSLTKLIERFRYKATKASMVQSRIKVLDKMERINPPKEHSHPTFLFKYKALGSKILLEVSNLYIGYSIPLLSKPINFSLERGEKLAITGFNGIGKSTFLKTISGQLSPIGGTYKLATNTIIGYYEQDNFFEDDKQTPVDYILSIYPKLTEREARSALAKCGLSSEQVLDKICTLSGGEQSKIKICRLILFPCNILILDEPTNHMDHNAIEQLSIAIKKFEGTVLFVSHDKDFIRKNADRIISFEDLISK